MNDLREFKKEWMHICSEFDCNVVYAKEKGNDCKGSFWKKECFFYGEHEQLNCDKYTVDGKKMSYDEAMEKCFKESEVITGEAIF